MQTAIITSNSATNSVFGVTMVAAVGGRPALGLFPKPDQVKHPR